MSAMRRQAQYLGARHDLATVRPFGAVADMVRSYKSYSLIRRAISTALPM